MILEEFDKSTNAVINPSHIYNKIEGFPKVGVACFSLKLFEEIQKLFNYEIIGYTGSCNGETPILKINYKDVDVLVFIASVGASPCVIKYEEILEMGMEKLVLFGTCGVLDKNIGDCSIIIPTLAMRDEGTSFHYMPAGDEIKVNSDEHIKIFEEILDEHKY
ncbi:MAG: phosphorylase, partial [Oscillospiraceae bacterium]